MGNPSAPSANESTAKMLQALSLYAPDAIKALNSTATGTAQAQLAADQATNQGYQDLNTANQMQAGRNELALATGTGSQLVDAANALQQKVDPEYYANRAEVGKAIDTYLNSYDPTKLSPTEEREIQQGLDRQSGPVSASAMNTIRNAAGYGSAGTQRWQNFGNAITQASTALPALKTGYTGFEVATQRALQPTTNAGQTALGNNFGFANNTLNQIGANQRLVQSQKKSLMDNIVQGTQAFNNVASGVGSII